MCVLVSDTEVVRLACVDRNSESYWSTIIRICTYTYICGYIGIKLGYNNQQMRASKNQSYKQVMQLSKNTTTTTILYVGR